jgi:hypothetical protein
MRLEIFMEMVLVSAKLALACHTDNYFSWETHQSEKSDHQKFPLSLSAE